MFKMWTEINTNIILDVNCRKHYRKMSYYYSLNRRNIMNSFKFQFDENLFKMIQVKTVSM